MKLVTTPNCGLCARVKTILQNKGVPFTVYSPDSAEGSVIVSKAPTKELPMLCITDDVIYCGKNALVYAKGI